MTTSLLMLLYGVVSGGWIVVLIVDVAFVL